MVDELRDRPLDLWIEERHRAGTALSFRVKAVLFSGTSQYQRVDIVETANHGKMLLNDGLIMLSERDEFSYHEMIAHVPMFVHPKPKQVLVIGGGDGGTVREVLRHRDVEHCELVEIDEMVVSACREHIPQTAAALDDKRVNVRIEDGVKFVQEASQKFDVVIVDSTDPLGPATPLFGPEFYDNVRNVLADDGIVVSQAESPFYDGDVQRSLLMILHNVFPQTSVYNYANVTYPGGTWSFSFASNGLRPLADFDPGRAYEAAFECQYYNADVHRAAFALPEFQRRNLEGVLGEP